MQTENPAPGVSDDLIVARLYDLARQGDTSTREYQLLDHVIVKRLLQTYGCDVTQGYAA